MAVIVADNLVAGLRIRALFQKAIHVVKRMRYRSIATFAHNREKTWQVLAVVPANDDILDWAYCNGRSKLAEAGLSSIGVCHGQGRDTRSFTINAGRRCET